MSNDELGFLGEVLTGHLKSLDKHLERFGSRPQGSRNFLNKLEVAALKGRGGAGFPAGIKWRTVFNQSQLMRSVVVGNGAEGEPASFKDRELLKHSPHLVLDGLQIAAETVNANSIYLYLRHDDKAGWESVRHALTERKKIKEIKIKIVKAPSHYVASEETAVVSRLNGKEAKPKDTPPRPFQKGVSGKPTLVQNVETLARIALLARGLEATNWTLTTLWGPGNSFSVVDVKLGTSFSELKAMGKFSSEEIRAVLVGGYFGLWFDWKSVADSGFGTEVPSGAGLVAMLGMSQCGLSESSRILNYLSRESARQCGPCQFGLVSMAKAVEDIKLGLGTPHKVDKLRQWSEEIVGRGACRFPDGASRFIISAMQVFSKEVNSHLRKGVCEGCLKTPFLPTPAWGGGWK
jgi:NADH:ubiquinone oxidoreductase subunit F (NADH-binding)